MAFSWQLQYQIILLITTVIDMRQMRKCGNSVRKIAETYPQYNQRSVAKIVYGERRKELL